MSYIPLNPCSEKEFKILNDYNKENSDFDLIVIPGCKLNHFRAFALKPSNSSTSKTCQLNFGIASLFF
jgi:hypothetical protein